MLKRITLTLAMAFIAGLFVSAQVTTSSITGFVKSDKGGPLEGATITAIHQPSGTKYVTISKKDGNFTIPNTKIGGPYTITAEFVGFSPSKTENVTLSLGEPFVIDLTLSTKTTSLSEVILTSATARSKAKTGGASTNVNSRMLNTLPTISRSITDFTRLTPQANGNSFGGRDGRYNNVTVDGANLNNNFGLSTDPLPGGGANPISLDAIEEITVNIAPYDVRQANFTGANISAVTKSGTNTFHGSAYGYYRNETFAGTNVAGFKLPPPAVTYNKIYGGTLGGPIIKNKLFFFLNGEYEEKPATLAYYTPLGGSGSGNISQVPIDSMIKLSNYLNTKYNYDPGAYDNFQSSTVVKNHKYLAKLDWNISTVNKLTIKYSDFQNSQNFLPSQSGGINGASSQSGIVTYGPKFSTTAMAFGNTVYEQVDKVKSGSFELTSNFHGKFANQLLVTATKISTDKNHPGAQFPFVDILGLTAGSKNNYLSFGNEPFNGNYNVVVNDVYTATDNFSYFAGKHTLTAGVSYEYQKVGNGFMPGSQGYYVYGSLDDFINNRAPKLFSITYSLVKGQDAVISANLKIGQAGAYIQDEVNVNDKLKITYGLRIDKPVYPEQPLPNNAVNAENLYDHSGAITTYNTGAWPKSSLYWSPRVGMRWNLPEEKIVIRAGTGLYTGRIPFVYLTNLPTGVGPYQFGTLITSNLQNFLFNPDMHTYNPFYNTSLNPAQFPTVGGTVVPTGAYALISPNFKFPQVWRTDFAVDKQLGNGFVATLEALYTKDINAVYMFNANQKAPDITMSGPDNRPIYSYITQNLSGGALTTARNNATKLNLASGNAVVLDNTAKGESFSLTALLTKNFAKGFYGSVAYTYTAALDVTANPGSQATSVWSANPTSRTQNDLELATSAFSVPHRVIASLSYRFEYANHLATTVSAFYEGAIQGTFSYIYNGDVNGDGNSADLMYIPRNPSEIHFVDLPASGNTPAFTAQQESDVFFKFIAQDPYLRKHQGQVAERNGTQQPWYNRVDLKFAQDFFIKIGSHRNTLQFTADILNFPNLINHDWGIKQFFIVNNPLKVVSYTNGQPNFQLATYIPVGTTTGTLIDRTYIHNNSLSSTYAIQLGLRYIF
ncbi:MAG: carboxypeptidase regulatory-like domain-containing protein [Bacteroidota bacterium]|nr:carboxypeptidase regulatory-like domain-containing protein [Bacteroidota bacterium]